VADLVQVDQAEKSPTCWLQLCVSARYGHT
jgi:hypothetical protein